MEEALIKRIPPHSIEAEQSVIGAMLLDRDAILIASEILTSDDFYQNQYGIIFDAMVELCNEGKPVDLITLQNRLKEKDLPPDISSMEYVRELIEAVPTSANVKYYANIVSEKALLRRLIKATEDVANTCYLEKESTEMILEESEKKLFNILQRSIGGDYVPIQQVLEVYGLMKILGDTVLLDGKIIQEIGIVISGNQKQKESLEEKSKAKKSRRIAANTSQKIL